MWRRVRFAVALLVTSEEFVAQKSKNRVGVNYTRLAVFKYVTKVVELRPFAVQRLVDQPAKVFSGLLLAQFWHQVTFDPADILFSC